MTFEEFNETRAEIIVHPDEPSVYGWFVAEETGKLIIKFIAPPPFSPGQTVQIRLNSPNNSLSFESRYLVGDESKGAFLAPSTVVRGRPSGSARVRGALDFATVHSAEGDYMSQVFDIGEDGLSIQTMDQYSPGDTFKVTVKLDKYDVTFDVRVSYCTIDPWSNERWRIGGRIENMGRTDQTRWRKLMLER